MDRKSPRRERSWGSALAEKKIDRLYWAGALILTLGVRLYLFRNYYTINNDGVLYIEAARHFWEGQWVEGLASFYPPLFPLMIVAVYPLVGDWELAGQFWPLILGVLILLPLFCLLRRVYGSRVAQVALLFYGVSPYLARLSLHVRSEIPYIFFLVLALYLLQRGMDSGSPFSLLLMGISSALTYLIRSEGFGLLIVGALFLLYRGWIHGRLEKGILQLAILFFGFILLAAPYILYLKQDTGRWLISRKAGLILSLGLAELDPSAEQVGMKESDRVSLVHLVSSRPLVYVKKIFIDAFRSLGVYFEALHYPYLPFLFIGWFFFFRGRFWEKGDFLLAATILFYLAAFSLLYVNRRYAVPLVPLSLGWVGAGYLALKEYFHTRWGRRGYLLTGLLLVFFCIGTLPKTLKAIGREKLYLREAGLYLKGKRGNPTILTTNGRVAFYAEGQNRILVKELRDFPAFLGAPEGDYLALDMETFGRFEESFKDYGWLLDREFSRGDKERLFVFRRVGIQ
ncbi:MAG: ArnT family glycosyltransferase [Candidatus Binatia bacterium]